MIEQSDYNMLGAVFQPGGGLNEPYCVEVAQKLHARHNVVINSGKVAELIQPHTYRVICRSKTLDWNDDNFASWDEPKVRAFVRRLHNESPADAALHLGNEQGVGQAELRNTTIGMDECEKLGRIAVIHNKAVKSYGNDPRVLDIYRENFERAYVQGHLWGDHATYFDRHWNTSHLFDFRQLRDDLMGGRFPEIVFTEGGCCFGYQAHRGYRWGPMPHTDEGHGEECVQMARVLQNDGVSVCLFLVSDDRRDNEWVDFIMRSPMITYMQQRPVVFKERKPVTYTWIEGRCESVPGTFVNVRSARAIDPSNVVDKLFPGMAVQYSTQTTDENGYRWTPLNWNGVTRWVAVLNLTTGAPVAVLSANPPPKPLEWSLPVDLTAWSITSGFGVPRDYDGDGVMDDQHEGIDFAPAQLTESSMFVRAMADGIVEKARWLDEWMADRAAGRPNNYGCYVRIKSQDGAQVYSHWYAHLSTPMVENGALVKRGQAIGVVGDTGNSRGTKWGGLHLHITIQAAGKGSSMGGLPNVIDPAVLLSELA